MKLRHGVRVTGQNALSPTVHKAAATSARPHSGLIEWRVNDFSPVASGQYPCIFTTQTARCFVLPNQFLACC